MRRCAVLLAIIVLPHAALAQDTPRLCVVAADTETGSVHSMADFPGGMLIGSEKGLFVARDEGASCC